MDIDILRAAELALPHRIRGQMFQEANVSAYDLEERLEQARSEWSSGEPGEPEGEEAEPSPIKKKIP